MHAVARTGPDEALRIQAKAVRASGIDFREDAAAAELAAVHHIIGADVMGAVRALGEARVRNIQALLVRAEREDLRHLAILHRREDRAGGGIYSVAVASGLLLRGLDASPVVLDSIAG